MAKNDLSIWRENPFASFRKEMDDLMESFFGKSMLPSESRLDAFKAPSIDIKENDKNIVLTAELPGMDQNDINLEVRNGMLTLTGEKKQETDEEKDSYHLVERRYGSFSRTIPFPERVDESAIDAKFDKGVLTVTMPIKPDSVENTRKIAIK